MRTVPARVSKVAPAYTKLETQMMPFMSGLERDLEQ